MSDKITYLINMLDSAEGKHTYFLHIIDAIKDCIDALN